MNLYHHVMQGEEKKWELCTVLFLAYWPSSAKHALDFILLGYGRCSAGYTYVGNMQAWV